MTEPLASREAPDLDRAMNLSERVRCALALHDAGYSFTPDPSDVAEMLEEYDRLTRAGAAQSPCCKGLAATSECRCERERAAQGHPPYPRGKSAKTTRTWDVALADRVMQLEAAGAEVLSCAAVLGLIAFVRDGEGLSPASSTDQREGGK